MKCFALFRGIAIAVIVYVIQKECSATVTSKGWTEIYSTTIVVTWETNPQTDVFVAAETSSVTNCTGGTRVNASENTHNVTNLRNGTRLAADHTYFVGICTFNNLEVADSTGGLKTGPEPIEFSAFPVDYNPTQIEVSWKDPCLSNGCGDNRIPENFTIFYKANNLATEEKVKVVQYSKSETKESLKGLNPNTEYNISIRTKIQFNKPGKQIFSDRSVGHLAVTVFSQPKLTNSDPITATESSLIVAWTEPDKGGGAQQIQNYVVKWSDGKANNQTTVEGAMKNKTISSLTSNTYYNITVAAENQNGNIGEVSQSAFGITTFGKPKRPIANNATESSINITWIEPEGGNAITLKHYSITCKPNCGKIEIQDSLTTGNIGNLESNTEYLITIAAVGNDDRTGAKSEAFTGRTVPSLPIILGSCNELVNTTELCVNWSKSSGGEAIEAYHLKWKKENSISSQSFSEPHVTNTDTYSYTIGNLQPGERVNVTIAANNSAGTSDAAAFNYASYPSTPRNVNITSTINSIRVNWAEPEGYVDKFQLELTVNGNLAQKEIVSGSIETYEFSDLLSGTEYFVSLSSLIILDENLILTSEAESKQTRTVGQSPSETAVDVGAIVGAVVGSIVGVILVVGFIYYYQKRRDFNFKQAKDRVFQPAISARTNNVDNSLSPISSANDNSTEALSQSRKVKLSDFDDYFKNMKENFSAKFAEEFEKLVPIGQEIKSDIGANPENKDRNRYKNTLPYDHNRVVLIISNEFPSDYINASYIKGFNRDKEFIATQGPRKTTTNDFWRMVWQENSKNIVMLTPLVEHGKKKCEQYWPSDSNPIILGEITIQLSSKEEKDDWIVHELSISKDGIVRNVSHFHYTAWPDHGVPETSKSIVSFVSMFRSLDDETPGNQAPTVVHCSAGVGRTGAFIAVDYLLQHLKVDQYVDIYELVYQMRLQRTLMVQTEDRTQHNIISSTCR